MKTENPDDEKHFFWIDEAHNRWHDALRYNLP